MRTLKSNVEQDEATNRVCRMFDYVFDGTIETNVHEMEKPDNFSIGLVVGPSGSGKSTILKEFGGAETHSWCDDKAIISHFGDDGPDRLSGAGLNSIPSWLKPYRVLSTGEKFRADLARALCDGCVIDEFTSTVDRTTAKSCARAANRFIKNSMMRNIVFASCHYDIIEWLEPDWVFDASTGKVIVGRGWERPKINLEIMPCTTEIWPVFAPHHYLSSSINKSARCWMATWNDNIVGFSSALPFPNGNFSNGWREHRTVVLPEYQGLGVGVRLSDAVANIFVSNGFRFFSKTVHPKMGQYRESSCKWRATSKNKKARHDYSEERSTKEDGHKMRHRDRVAYSHEYIG